MVGSFQKEKKALPGESRNLCTFEKKQASRRQCGDISIAVTSTQVSIGPLLLGCPRPVGKNHIMLPWETFSVVEEYACRILGFGHVVLCIIYSLWFICRSDLIYGNILLIPYIISVVWLGNYVRYEPKTAQVWSNSQYSLPFCCCCCFLDRNWVDESWIKLLIH